MDQRQSCTGENHGIYRRPLAAEITTTSAIAAIQVRESLKIICGRQEDCLRHILMYDGMGNFIEVLEVEIDGRCDLHGQRNMRAAAGENTPGTMER
jgi:hypothetical protein